MSFPQAARQVRDPALDPRLRLSSLRHCAGLMGRRTGVGYPAGVERLYDRLGLTVGDRRPAVPPGEVMLALLDEMEAERARLLPRLRALERERALAKRRGHRQLSRAERAALAQVGGAPAVATPRPPRRRRDRPVTAPTAVRPAGDEFAPFYAPYVAAVPDGDVVHTLHEQGARMRAALASVPPEREGHRYAEEKWSVRELVAHVADAERIFAYRLLRIGRGDATPLPAFEENSYAAASGADRRPLAEIAEEMESVRAATLTLVRGLPAEAWTRRGTASEVPVSARALAWILAGHAEHHLRVLRDRYGVG